MKNPAISNNLLKEIRTQKTKIVRVDGLKIRVDQDVFPVASDNSRSSRGLFTVVGDLKDKKVLDIGTGTGVLAMRAAVRGAKSVIATDINDKAVKCALNNIKANRLEKIIKVVKSDLFRKVPKTKFDLIFANLPITKTDEPAKDWAEKALFDHGYKLHKRLLKLAPLFLKTNGFLVMSHANLQGPNSFIDFEKLIKNFGFSIAKVRGVNYRGFWWRFYKLKFVG